MENLRTHVDLIDRVCSEMSDSELPEQNLDERSPKRMSSSSYTQPSRMPSQEFSDKSQEEWKDAIIRYHHVLDYCFADKTVHPLELQEGRGRLPIAQPVSVIVKDSRPAEDQPGGDGANSTVPSPTSSYQEFIDTGSYPDEEEMGIDSVTDELAARYRKVGGPLKGVPVSHKSRRTFIPDDKKDQKYWERRKRNNEAAKRSREARRYKELEVTKRCDALQNENEDLKVRMSQLEQKNSELDATLKIYRRLLLSKNISPPS